MKLLRSAAGIVSNEPESDRSRRFAIYERELNELLSNHAPDEPARTHLRQIIVEIQRALHIGLPLRTRASSSERRTRVDQLKVLEGAFGHVAWLLKRRAAPAQQVVSDILGAEIARALTNQAFEDAGVRVSMTSERELAIIRSRSREPEAAVAEEAERARAMRRKQAASVLSSLHARCHALVAAQLEVERGHRGGRPSHPEREYILISIAMVFEDIFGKVPTASETGRYVELSAAVLRLFRLETLGVEAAAKRLLAKARRSDTAGSKPPIRN